MYLLTADDAQLDGDAQVVLLSIQLASVRGPNLSKGRLGWFGNDAVAGELVVDAKLRLRDL